jgi:hypothetical protein
MTRSSGSRLQILYVAGVPRTGSTVLGLLLGEVSDAIFVGELNFFWRRFAQGELCSCRRPLPRCPFWSAVVTEAYGNLTPAQAVRMAELERRVLRRQFALGLAPAAWRPRSASAVGVMLSERAQLYHSIGSLTGATWIVDAGKEPVFGSFLARVDGAEIGTIHLVRDPRGVAFSWQKLVPSDSEPRDMPRKAPARTAVDWVLQNTMVQLGMRRLSSTYVRVRYEELVTRPEHVLREISRATSLAMAAPTRAPGPRGNPGDHHLVAGNPAVRQLAGHLRLRPDEDWRTQLPRAQQHLVTAICGGLMAAYGYPLRAAAQVKRPGNRSPS